MLLDKNTKDHWCQWSVERAIRLRSFASAKGSLAIAAKFIFTFPLPFFVHICFQVSSPFASILSSSLPHPFFLALIILLPVQATLLTPPLL